jgi:molybdopterin converting factor small subunit
VHPPRIGIRSRSAHTRVAFVADAAGGRRVTCPEVRYGPCGVWRRPDTRGRRMTTEDTPKVTLHVFGSLRTYCADAAEILIAAQTVRAALEDLEQNQAALYRNICDETGVVRRHLNVFVNDDNVRDLDGINTRLTQGDVLSILPAVSGG